MIYISGGQRSGKSGYAQRLARSLSDRPIYLATARHWDEEFERRIARHQADRGPEWTTIEEPRYLSQTQIAGRVVLIDCVTLWLTNIYSDLEFDAEASLSEARREWQELLHHCKAEVLIVVSNEIGMSLHAPDAGSRAFVDLQGWVNQYISATADEAYLMVSGRALCTELISDLYKEESR
ncbi:bifunctional adenosylcobinamide kinase/adenosylcobinamide-phosphate guanylyltransferase [Porphyromonas uenonis]|uniref:bifunctional adenosylcobinamide kinase/adenosylcobinamide-phosphate guanylyltransferase n=1 Tax=Porphyromonas uenonis TaxID=281920 RepID=UPI001E591046|nr:bifunctional adenosylcobinamide kinase/adenosylcobinamide-phosphate guanylyltransferase [Porphyromonas uenonis]